MATDAATAPTPEHPATNNEPSIQWDGDRMFNIYIYDYCVKRGFRKTAHELQQEASIPAQSQPPINAKQGLLFEWWSVFWVLFTAKSNGNGPDDAIVYTQHQAQVQAAVQKQQQARPQPPGQQQQGRYPNGTRLPNQSGPQPNGIGPPAPQQTGSLQNGTQNSVPFPGNMQQQPNGVPGPSTGPAGPGGQAPPHGQGQNIPQRQVVPQQRGVNGAPFQSPTMAHSPPHGTGGAQPSNPIGNMGSVGTNQPLTQMGASRGVMLPPNGPQGPMGNPQQHTPQPAFQQLVGRTPSNPGSPANNMMQPSPSIPNRQPPGMGPMSMDALNQEMNRIPPPMLPKLRQEAGVGEKDVTAMTVEEKQQIVAHFRRSSNMKPPGMPGPSNVPPGQPGPSPMQTPSGLRNAQMPQNAQQPGQQPLQPQPAPNQQQRGSKRNSTSPGQEPEQLPRNDSSPPDRKRVRRSPANGEQAQQPPMTPMYAHPPQPGPGQQMQPPMQHNGMIRGPMQMNPFPGPPMQGMNQGMNNPMLGHGLGTPQMSQMNPPMNPAMMGQPGPPGMVNNPQIHQYRQTMQAIHKPPHLQQVLPVGVGSPSSSDPQGGGGPPGQNRMGQNKPMSGMMPPPSPAMSAKMVGGGPIKSEEGPGGPPPPNGRIDASPQNTAAGIGGGHQGPGAPVPMQAPRSSSTPAPQTPGATGPGAMAAPSPSAILSASSHPPPPPPPPSAAGPNPADTLDPTSFPLDFGAGLGEFDPSSIFDANAMNFERDFAAWFDPENAQ